MQLPGPSLMGTFAIRLGQTNFQVSFPDLEVNPEQGEGLVLTSSKEGNEWIVRAGPNPLLGLLSGQKLIQFTGNNVRSIQGYN